MPPHQFIWFLAPTVSLCSQQFEYLQSQLSSVQIRFLSGADGVDHWTEQNLWDSVLKNVKVVVSTYQVLLDALSHAFVCMGSLALIVFDEAHNCVGKHPGSKLMQSFYHKCKSEGTAVPHILGLTASPLMRSDPLSLNKIEETLDAICRTPKKHRAELRLQVKLPVLSQVFYQSLPAEGLLTGYTRTIDSLGTALKNLKFTEDPYIISLVQEDTEKSRRKLDKIRLNRKTRCQDQMNTLFATSLRICSELGAWAADHYISEVVGNVTTKLAEETESFLGVWDISSAEKQYLATALKQVEITRTDSRLPLGIPLVSDKVTKLIQTLLRESSGFSGIVFVQERATAEVLARLLSLHPDTRDKFKVGTMVGTSTHNYRARNIAELITSDSQKQVLSRFRSGAINLMVATSVLEEGIDIPACNVVLCFQKPVNLKSFVQRRGRARQRDSKLILLLDSTADKLGEYQQLEQDMKKIYEDDMRSLAELLTLEDGEQNGERSFRVESTGALLDLDNAVSRLYHFCATLPAKEYVDLRPEFICSEAGGSLVRARVVLPLSVNKAVRTAESLSSWQSERNAIKDAAFEAYIALYRAGLVNDNLLPLMRHDTDAEELTLSTVEKRASTMVVSEQLNPWITISKAWKNLPVGKIPTIRQASIVLEDLEMEIYLPIDVPPVPPFRLYWDFETELLATPNTNSNILSPETLPKATKETSAILQAGFGSRFVLQQRQHVMLFSPKGNTVLRTLSGCQSLSDRMCATLNSASAGLVKDILDSNVSFIYKGWLSGKPAISNVQNPYNDYACTPQDSPHIAVKRLPRRLDFLHRRLPGNSPPSSKRFAAVLPVSRCTMDNIPFRYVRFALLIPSIIHRFGIYFIAQELSTTVLKAVGISDISLVVTAICASSANEETNYQRLEFLGDSILKLCTSIQLMAEYPLWHEGLLSAKKDRIVSNARLSRAAVEAGLDRFIITKIFTGHKWRPLYVDDMAEMTSDSKRDLSSKVLADVVEALIGAAMVDGGIPKALACLRALLPELNWQSLEVRQSFLFQRAPELELPSTLQPLEILIGYHFKKKSLLTEAMTHASCNTGSESLERFEYLGDAILDNIIVTAMYPHELSHVQMHLLRTALVNADFLAFICMEWSIEQETSTLEKAINDNGSPPTLKPTTSRISWPFWRFMRHMSQPLGRRQFITAKKHAEIRGQIKSAIEGGSHYPWALLARLQAHKFFSDIIESLLGAVWIDSGSFDTCKDVVERMGILPYFRRILEEKVHILHPKEELGMLADTETVKYTITNRKVKNEMGESVEFLCTISVGGREIVSVGGGVGNQEVKTKAAEEAVRILKLKKGGEDQTMGGS